eukprot:scaffold23948_cov40-Prasinocladus_malaysianus.AAC.1
MIQMNAATISVSQTAPRGENVAYLTGTDGELSTGKGPVLQREPSIERSMRCGHLRRRRGTSTGTQHAGTQPANKLACTFDFLKRKPMTGKSTNIGDLCRPAGISPVCVCRKASQDGFAPAVTGVTGVTMAVTPKARWINGIDRPGNFADGEG